MLAGVDLSREVQVNVLDVGRVRRHAGVPITHELEVDQPPRRAVVKPDVAQQAPVLVGLGDVLLEDDRCPLDERPVGVRGLTTHPFDGRAGLDRLGRVHPDVPQPFVAVTPIDHDRVSVDDPDDAGHFGGSGRSEVIRALAGLCARCLG